MVMSVVSGFASQSGADFRVVGANMGGTEVGTLVWKIWVVWVKSKCIHGPPHVIVHTNTPLKST